MYSFVKLVCQHEAMVQTFTVNDPALTFILTGTQDTTATFAEQEEFKTILRAGWVHFDIQAVCEVATRRAPFPQFPQFPVFTASIGSLDPKAPAVGFFGGIHGLERIGTQVLLHYMRVCFSGRNGTNCCASNLKKSVSYSCRSSTRAAHGRTSGPTGTALI